MKSLIRQSEIFLCHMSNVPCHVSPVMCHTLVFDFGHFFTKWRSYSVECLLSTGPTPSNQNMLAPCLEVWKSCAVFPKKSMQLQTLNTRLGRSSYLSQIGRSAQTVQADLPIQSRIGISAYPLDGHVWQSIGQAYMPILDWIGRSAYLGINMKIFLSLNQVSIVFQLVNRTGVAGAVLQTPLSLIH